MSCCRFDGPVPPTCVVTGVTRGELRGSVVVLARNAAEVAGYYDAYRTYLGVWRDRGLSGVSGGDGGGTIGRRQLRYCCGDDGGAPHSIGSVVESVKERFVGERGLPPRQSPHVGVVDCVKPICVGFDEVDLAAVGCATSGGRRRQRAKKRKSDASCVDLPGLKAESLKPSLEDLRPAIGKCETVISQVQLAEENAIPVWRRTASSKPSDSLPGLSTGVSQLSSVSAAPVDLRLELKRTYDLRRVAENLLAVRQAEVKLEGLNDVSRTADLNALKKQQIVQWVNESVAKSQASLDKVKSVDPGSSISQADIRALVKENEDLKFQHGQVFEHLDKEFGVEKSAEILRIVQPLSSEDERQLVDEAQEYADNFLF